MSDSTPVAAPERLSARAAAAGKMMAPNFQKVREILKKQLDDAVDAKVTPKEALATVQKQVEAVIKR